MSHTRPLIRPDAEICENDQSSLTPNLIIHGLQTASTQACVLVDTSFVVRFCNHPAREIFSPLVRQAIAPGLNLFHLVKAEHRGPLKEVISATDRGCALPLDLEICGSSGSPVNLRIEVVRIADTQDATAGYCLNALDLTAACRIENTLRESLEFNQAVFKHSPIGISVRDRHGRLLNVNPAWCRIWNRTETEVERLKATEKRSLQFDERDSYLGPWQQKVRDIYRHGGELFIPEIELTGRRQISTQWISHYFYAMESHSGQVERVVILTEDLTERKRQERERGQAHRLEMLGLLAGGIAHGFNNVLQGFLGHVALAKEELTEGEDSWHHLSVAEKVAEQASHLTQQLLTFAKGGEPVRQPTNTTGLITDAVSLALKNSTATVRFSLEPDLPWINVDNGQVARAIQNVVLNAVQAMPEGGRVMISAKVNRLPEDAPTRGGSDAGFVLIRISDNGHGIPSDQLQRVWDPYYSTREGHTGLGLTAAYAIVNKHNGLLKIDSKPGCGTTVDMWLPACNHEANDPIHLDTIDPTGSERILVMDDEDFIRELMAKSLTRYGYHVSVAGDGSEAVRLYQQARSHDLPFDLVILDLVVSGGMGGQEAFEKLKSLDPDVRVLVCSGYSADPIMANYRQYGFLGVVKKPFRPRALAQAVRFHCDKATERDHSSDTTQE